MKLLNSITAKLTFWYAIVVFVTSLIILAVVNLVYGNFVTRTLDEVLPQRIRFQIAQLEERQGGIRLRDVLQDIRNNDLAQVQRISLIVIVANLLLAAGGGYLLARQMLKPVKRLNHTMSAINSNNLKTRIDNYEADDEIGELINNFNQMTERLDKAFSAQGDFVANAAHELKTPLAIMRTNIETAQLSKTVERKQFLQTAVDTTKRMNLLIEDLLLLSSINPANFDFQTLNLTNLVAEIVSELQNQATRRSVKLNIEGDKNSIKIKGYRPMLQRAISNIIENAIKYSRKGGEVKVSLSEENKFTVVRIKDNGPGIALQFQDKVFERFYRIDDSRSRKSGGTGLGLPIAKEIIEMHKGKITLKSKLEHGSEFIINFPK